MPNSIELFQNTLLQLIIRQGSDSTRQNVVLKSGELGYTTDTKKLYIGDGTTLGGTLVGGAYAGSATNITTLSPASIGDLAFDTDNNKLYRLSVNDGSNISDWELIGGVYSALDTTLTFSSDNKVSVGTISGGNISSNALSNPIYINGSNQVALSAKVPLDEIVPRTGDTLKLPIKIQIGSNTYTFSNELYENGNVFYIENDEIVTRSPATINDAISYTSTQNLPISSTKIARDNVQSSGRLIGRESSVDSTHFISLSNLGKTLRCGLATANVNFTGITTFGESCGITTSFASISIIGVDNVSSQEGYTFAQYERDSDNWLLTHEIPLSA
jgi:Major tropism determinant N-terminal domain